MNLYEAQQLAKTLMNEHLSGEWTFAWNNRKRAFGLCSYTKKQVQLSKILTQHGKEEQVRNTILHEIAHAIAGHGAGHGPAWKAAARRIGCNASRTGASTEAQRAAIGHKWEVYIVDTNEVVSKYLRKPGARICNNIHVSWIPGRKAETHGKLRLRRVA